MGSRECRGYAQLADCSQCYCYVAIEHAQLPLRSVVLLSVTIGAAATKGRVLAKSRRAKPKVATARRQVGCGERLAALTTLRTLALPSLPAQDSSSDEDGFGVVHAAKDEAERAHA